MAVVQLQLAELVVSENWTSLWEMCCGFKLRGWLVRFQGSLALLSLCADQDERSPAVFSFTGDSSDRFAGLGKSHFAIPSFWGVTTSSLLLLV